MYTASANNFQQWRTTARKYLCANISPEQIQWSSEQQAGLFAEMTLATPSKAGKSNINVPAAFLSRLQQASHYIGNVSLATKWSLFYSLLWRITKVNRNTLHLKSDSQVQQLERMVKSVNRDMHKMKAFVRFKSDTSVFEETADYADSADHHYTAWFESEHAIIEPISPFFVKRFTSMNWSILTPYGCAHWDQTELVHSPGISRPDINDDEFDHFWRAYYRSIFNPARVKEKSHAKRDAKKYWKYLPESVCIKELTSQAAMRVDNMVEADTTDSERVRQSSTRVTTIQDQLRQQNKT